MQRGRALLAKTSPAAADRCQLGRDFIVAEPAPVPENLDAFVSGFLTSPNLQPDVS